MDIRKVKKLIELLEESGIDELEIREGEESVRISRHSKTAAQPVYAQAPAFAAKKEKKRECYQNKDNKKAKKKQKKKN